MDRSAWLSNLIRVPFRRLRTRFRCRRISTLLRRAAREGAIRIVVGAGTTQFEGWISTDIEILDLLKDGTWERLLTPGSVSAILAEHVWEHLSEEEAIVSAGICFRFLKRGGYLRVAVPDGLHPDPVYLRHVGPPADGHKILYTYRTLEELFVKAGFTVRPYEHFDEQGVLHVEEWDPEDGTIVRSKRFGLPYSSSDAPYTSIILDAIKG